MIQISTPVLQAFSCLSPRIPFYLPSTPLPFSFFSFTCHFSSLSFSSSTLLSISSKTFSSPSFPLLPFACTAVSFPLFIFLPKQEEELRWLFTLRSRPGQHLFPLPKPNLYPSPLDPKKGNWFFLASLSSRHPMASFLVSICPG